LHQAFAIDPSIAIAVRILVAAIFAEAVAGKLWHLAELQGVIANYRLLPTVVVPIASWCLLGLEASIPFLLTFDAWVRRGAILAAALLVTFGVAIAINLLRGRSAIDCGCFQSGLRQQLSGALVMRNLVLAGMVLTLANPMGTAMPLQWINGLSAGLALFLLYHIFGLLFALQRSGNLFSERLS
jgi:Methylamine utilisation protein MauE